MFRLALQDGAGMRLGAGAGLAASWASISASMRPRDSSMASDSTGFSSSRDETRRMFLSADMFHLFLLAMPKAPARR
jgi:hypothetical protein